MLVKSLNRLLYASFTCIIVIILNACSSSKKIDVRDDSTLISSRKEFFERLYSSIEQKQNGISSYYSKKINVSSNSIPLYNSVNAAVYIGSDSIFVSKVYLPFPVVEVAKLQIYNGFLMYESKVANKDGIKTFPDDMLPLMRSSIIGNVPQAFKFFGDNDFRNFTLYIENNKYVLYRADQFVSIKIIINDDMTLSKVNANYMGMSMIFDCSDYTNVDNFMLPKSMNLAINQGNNNFDFKINVKNITLNGSAKLEY